MSFVDIVTLDRLPIDRGVSAIVGDEYVAVFRLACGEVLAIDHIDPFTAMPVLARGLVGSVGDSVVVASPLHKQRFDLRTGVCVDDPSTSVRTWKTIVTDGVVRIDLQPTADAITAGPVVVLDAIEPPMDRLDAGAA